jgi:O-antigen ligase
VPTAAALDTGRETAVLLAALAGGAAAARALLVVADARLSRWRAPRMAPWPVRGIAVGLVVVLVIAGLAAGGVDRARQGWEDFSQAGVVGGTELPGERLVELGNNGRIEVWDVALRSGFEPRPWTGSGAGTYELLWDRDRPAYRNMIDGHSLYLETLGEMGIVGLALLGTALACLLGGLWWRALADREPAWAALAAVATGWAVHAGVDWDWEMPAVSAWVFCAGGLALSRPAAALAGRRVQGALARPLGILAGVGCLVLALVPVSILRSQGPLIEAQRALRAGDCAATIDRSVSASSALGVRPEPLELLAWCDVRLGRYELALAAAEGAVRRDPRNWEPRYTQALVRAVAGQDPRSAARAALARNPLHPYAQDAVRRFTAENRRRWRQLALEAKLPLGGGS